MIGNTTESRENTRLAESVVHVSGNAQQFLSEVPSDLDGTIAAVDVFAQQNPGFEGSAITSKLRHAERLLDTLANAVGPARERLDDARRRAGEAGDAVEIARGRQATTLEDLRAAEQAQRDADTARAAVDALAGPVEAGERLVLVVCEAVGWS